VNVVFFAIVAIAFLVSAGRQIAWAPSGPEDVSPMDALTTAVVESAGDAVTLAIGLVGMMALFLGLMKVAEAGGLLTIIARTLRPVMVRAFPDVPPDHPAMGAMILNMSANALGLGNAATPFGIRAMQALDTLNPHKGTATNAMALFLAINTSAVTLLPTGVIALRASVGSIDPAGILPTTLFASLMSTATAFVAVKLYQRWSPFTAGEVTAAVAQAAAQPPSTDENVGADDGRGYSMWVSLVVLLLLASGIPLAVV
jgi:spore maturation protein SpmA